MKFEIDNEIKDGLNKKIYLLFGEEKYLINKYKSKIIETLIPNKEDLETDLTIFDSDKVSANSIIDASEMFSFTGGQRTILVKESNFFYKGKTNEAEIFADFLKSSDDEYTIIFIESNVDKRSKLYKAVQKYGYSQEFTNLKSDDVANFIINETKKNDSNISLEDAKYLALNLYNDLENVVSEVEKLSSYKFNDTITIEDIDLLASKNLEVRVFELVDKLGQKKAKDAIEIFNNMILVKESPIMVLTMIGRTFKTLLLCKTLLEKGISQDEIARKTKLHPFVVKKNTAITRNFKKTELYNGMFDVLDADEKIKTGQLKDTIAVENIILKYAK